MDDYIVLELTHDSMLDCAQWLNLGKVHIQYIGTTYSEIVTVIRPILVDNYDNFWAVMSVDPIVLAKLQCVEDRAIQELIDKLLEDDISE